MKNYFSINFQLIVEEQGLWSSLWKSKLHQRLKLFLWRVLSNVLPTKEALNIRILMDNLSCGVCGEGTESLLHLFNNCNGFRALTFACCWGGKPDAWPTSSIQDIVEACLNPPTWMRGRNMEKNNIPVVMASIMYGFWGFLNDCLFKGIFSIMERSQMIEQYVKDFSKILKFPLPPPLRTAASILISNLLEMVNGW